MPILRRSMEEQPDQTIGYRETQRYFQKKLSYRITLNMAANNMGNDATKENSTGIYAKLSKVPQ
jgi:hypothetical protein